MPKKLSHFNRSQRHLKTLHHSPESFHRHSDRSHLRHSVILNEAERSEESCVSGVKNLKALVYEQGLNCQSLDIHILPEDRAQRFANDASGIGELVELAKEMEASLIVMEATGGLESALAAECALSGIPTAVMNPRQIRDFARSLGRLAKTDAIDAEVIARFGSALRPEPRRLPDAQEQHLRALMTRRRQLIDIRTAESNRLARAAAAVRQRIRKHIDFLNQEIEDIDREIEKLIKESPLWLEKARLLREVPGIGSVSCFTLLGALLSWASSKESR